jgi:hypothetical protein
MRICPFCAEKVQDKAVVCKHCKNRLPAIPRPRICKNCDKEDKSVIGIKCSNCGTVKQSAYVAIPLLVAILCAFLLSCYSLLANEPVEAVSTPPAQESTPSVDPEYSRKILVQTCAQMYVVDMLKAPSTAKHPWVLAEDMVTKISEGKYLARSYVDAENAFGAMLREYYTCDVELSEETCSNVTCGFD